MQTLGYGTTIKFGADAAAAAAASAIAQVMDITAPEGSREGDDTTTQDSPDHTTESDAGWITEGTLSFDLKFDSAGHSALATVFRSPAASATKVWIVEYPDGHKDTFSGWISRLGKAAPLKGKMTAKVEITVTGKVTETAAA